ncbi:MAG: hypothetical protein MZW92_26435 [Comamonadaceae bacterium]|nr:hypothetical protein [Comamonadaceae bacterium]
MLHFNGSVFGRRSARRGRLPRRADRHRDVDRDPPRSKTDQFSIPVVVELERSAIRGLDGRSAANQQELGLPALVERGLRAKLSMQSLLTGQLYVDLDLRPERPARVGRLPRPRRDPDSGDDDPEPQGPARRHGLPPPRRRRRGDRRVGARAGRRPAAGPGR